MKNKKEINAGIIIIGNEVLSGRTKDINTSTLSLWLNSLGVQVKEVRIIPDNEKDIAANTVTRGLHEAQRRIGCNCTIKGRPALLENVNRNL